MERDRRTFLVSAGAAGVFAAGDAAWARSAPERGGDRALWLSWYDLPDDGRDAHLAWLHGSYLPALLKRPGFMWAAHYAAVPRGTMRTIRRDGKPDPRLDPTLPAGDRYILMFGAAHANVFGDPAPAALNAGLPEADRKMLALRAGERVNVMVEAARVEGPEAKNRGRTASSRN